MTSFCFILMPFGKKTDARGVEIDFDTVYERLIKPAVADAGLEPVRADEEMVGGFIHKPMYERLLLSEFAIADLTTANANVFYELGVRHTARPYHTLSLFEKHSTLPFDVQPLRAITYEVDGNGLPVNVDKTKEKITAWLVEAKKNPKNDSPLFQFFDDLKPQMIPHEKTDVFRERVAYSQQAKERLAGCRRKKSVACLERFEKEIDFDTVEGGVLIDLFLSYRALDAWEKMVALAQKMPDYLAKSLMVQEQLGFALNRLDRREEAERLLLAAIEKYGKNSETLGILGRVYKDRWDEATTPIEKEAWFDKAVETYIEGYECDIRDTYPGINAVTLLSLAPKPDERLDELLPTVIYALKTKMKRGSPDYWDYATLLELEVIAKNAEGARKALRKALPLATEEWMKATTQKTLMRLKEPWAKECKETGWLDEIIQGLD